MTTPWVTHTEPAASAYTILDVPNSPNKHDMSHLIGLSVGVPCAALVIAVALAICRVISRKRLEYSREDATRDQDMKIAAELDGAAVKIHELETTANLHEIGQESVPRDEDGRSIVYGRM